MSSKFWDNRYGPQPCVFQGWCITEGCGKEVFSKTTGCKHCKDCLRETYAQLKQRQYKRKLKFKPGALAPDTGE